MTEPVAREVPLDLARRVLGLLEARGWTLATAESLTGGGVAERLTAVSGASSVYVGGVVAYAGRVKVRLLGVPDDVVSRDGVVSARCALAMAAGVRGVVGADVGLATTGVAGPESQEEKPVGLVYVAVSDPVGEAVRELRLRGDREAVRAQACAAALVLLQDRGTRPPPESREVCGLG